MPNENLPAVAARAHLADGRARKEAATPAPAKDKSEYRFVIRTPVATFRGERGGVRFNDGVGYTDDEAAAQQCDGLGYQVETQRPARKKDAEK